MARKVITDFDEAMKEVAKYGFNLRFCSEELKDDSLVVLEAVTSLPIVLSLASPILRDNDPLALYAVELDGEAIDCVSERLKNNLQVALTALKQNPNAIQFVGKALREKIGGNDPVKFLELSLLAESMTKKVNL